MPKTKKPDAVQDEVEEKRHKSTAAQMERRITEIYRLIVKGTGRADIFEHIQDRDAKLNAHDKPEERAKAWNVSEDMLDIYIGKATARFKEYAAKQREEMFAKSVARLEFVYASCIRVQDYSKAIAALRELHLLMGLHEPLKLKQTHEGTLQHNHAGAFEVRTIDYRQTARAIAPDSEPSETET